MITITTSSSTSVNPRRRSRPANVRVRRCRHHTIRFSHDARSLIRIPLVMTTDKKSPDN